MTDLKLMIYKKLLFTVCMVSCMLVVSAEFLEAFNPIREIKKAGRKISNVVVGSGTPWYKDYITAEKAARKGDWETAIPLFEKALEQEPDSKTWTNRDGSKGEYYPYLQLGMAHLVMGNFDAASEYCRQADEYDVAPKPAVRECLDFVTAEKTPEPVVMPAEALVAAVDTDEQEEELPVQQPVVESDTKSAERKLAIGDVPADSIEPPTEGKAGETYAVIIGLSDFKDERIPDLRYTLNDAQGMYDVLTDPNYGGVPQEHVKLLLNKEATTRNIKAAVGKWLKSQVREDDTVILFFAGHGAPEGEETYWVTYDADIDDLYSTALDNKSISDMLARVDARRMISFLDSCYSAATVNRSNRTRDVQVEVPWEHFQGEGNLVISASNGTQLSLEMEAYQHGVFTYHILEAMKGQADGTTGEAPDGVIEVEEVWNYVRNRVTETAKQYDNKQTPVLQGTLTAGIPLTYNKPFLEEMARKREEEKQGKLQKLKTLFEQKEIPAELFDCAFLMLDAGQSNNYLDGLLAEKISPKTFRQLFTCDTEEGVAE